GEDVGRWPGCGSLNDAYASVAGVDSSGTPAPCAMATAWPDSARSPSSVERAHGEDQRRMVRRDDRVRGTRRAVDEIPLPEGALIALDQQVCPHRGEPRSPRGPACRPRAIVNPACLANTDEKPACGDRYAALQQRLT